MNHFHAAIFDPAAGTYRPHVTGCMRCVFMSAKSEIRREALKQKLRRGDEEQKLETPTDVLIAGLEGAEQWKDVLVIYRTKQEQTWFLSNMAAWVDQLALLEFHKMKIQARIAEAVRRQASEDE